MTQQPQYYSVLYDKKMKKLSDWLFDIGFFPILHEAVKRDFLSWYYEASQSEIFDNEVDLDNSDLIELTDQARQRAENFDQNNPLIELIDVFEDLKSTIDTYIIYIAFFALLIGGGIFATAVFQVRDLVYTLMIGTIGSIFLVGGPGVIVIYRVFVHQMKTNSQLVAKFNKELVEPPGDVRRNDQDWNKLAARLFWNKSLSSPTTHICLIILSLIRVLSVNLYGLISADLQQEVEGFVGMETLEIIRHQLDRLATGDMHH